MRVARFLLPLVLLAPLTACPRQGEGERCDLAAGASGEDSDCDDGLVCQAIDGLEGEVCCPEDLNTATALSCIPLSSAPPGEGGSDAAAGGSAAGTGGTGGTDTTTVDPDGGSDAGGADGTGAGGAG
ncbi:MAG: hypothetical protein AAGA56_30350 [Myxococcota bacterium]